MQDGTVVLEIVDGHFVVISARGECLAIGGVRNALDIIRVCKRMQDGTVVLEIVDGHFVVPSARGECLAIGGVRNATDLTRVFKYPGPGH